ncbi:MAG: hypothetical protein JNJ57_11520 [Saprospiraceae bacterium]|nr:hypothetical protein [Saprospiraceae bacterium]
MKTIKKAGIGFLILGLTYLGIMFFPTILFAHKIEYKQCTVYSDRNIDAEIYGIIDSALVRMSTSELYDTTQHFRLFLCNDLWRFGFFTQGSTLADAVAQYDLTRNIFFRPCDIPNHKIIPPNEWYFAKNPFSFNDRPLWYYFAHEMTHVMQSRYTGRGSWNYPTWLTEGYADYIGKGGNFNFRENLALWHDRAPELDPSKGLYRLYHLKVYYLMQTKGYNIQAIYQNIPDDAALTAELWNLPVPENEDLK